MSIKNVKPTLKTGYRQGYFTPINPEKYSGDCSEIIFRSSWELKFFQFCDNTESVVLWGSESTSIKYWNPILKKEATYWVDCYMATKTPDGSIIKWLIEVKPNKYLNPPEEPKRLTEKATLNYARHAKAYVINDAKFKAAQVYAKKNNMRFGIITENFLFNKV
jgi:hypothetical protein